MSSKTKVMIADDQKTYRELIINYFKNYNIEVIAQAKNGRELLSLLENDTPDIVLLDIEMPEMDGTETLERLKVKHPSVKIIVVTQYNEEELIKDLFNRGISAYIPKNGEMEIMIKAINFVKELGTYRDNLPCLGLQRKTSSRNEFYKQLYSRREREIIRLLCDGFSNRDLSEKLHIAEKTLEAHLSEIYRKAEVKTRSEFLVYAIKEGLNFLGGSAYI